MKNALGSLLLILDARVPAISQTGACRADLKHPKLPEGALIDDELIPLASPHLTFLFSQDGIDAYSATDFATMKLLK